jgi:outer membrane protein TolC
MKLHFLSKIIIFFLLFLSLNNLIKAQQVYYLTLDSAIAMAKEKSYNLRILRESLYQAQFQVQSIRRSFLPSLNFNGNLPSFGESLEEFSNSDTSYKYFKKTRSYNGNFNLTQKLPTDASLSLGYNIDNTDLYNNYKSRVFSSSTSISLNQPLNSLFFYNPTKTRYKQAKLSLELAEKQYKRNELDLIYQVSRLFYDCVSNEKQKEIALQTLKRQEEAFKLATNKYKSGIIKEVEALQIEVDYGDAVNNYESQITAYDQSANELKMELGLSLNDSISTSNKLEYKSVLIDQNKALEYGLKNRTELRERQIQISYNEMNIKSQRAEGMIQGSIGVHYNLTGLSSTGLDYPYWSAYETSMHNMMYKPGAYGVYFTISIPILDWGSNRSLVKMQKSRLKENQLRYEYQLISIENEIRNNIFRINNNLKKLLLLEKTIKLAEKSYDISYQRFTNGDIDVETLGLDRIRYTSTQNSYLQAYINYKLLLLDLTRKTFYDFENNVSLVPEVKE